MLTAGSRLSHRVPPVAGPQILVRWRVEVNMIRVNLKLYRSRAGSLRGVMPEIGVWRAANLMLKCYGEKALEGRVFHFQGRSTLKREVRCSIILHKASLSQACGWTTRGSRRSRS
jgi:hypothetical protein